MINEVYLTDRLADSQKEFKIPYNVKNLPYNAETGKFLDYENGKETNSIENAEEIEDTENIENATDIENNKKTITPKRVAHGWFTLE